jgi:hypothetical protein
MQVLSSTASAYKVGLNQSSASFSSNYVFSVQTDGTVNWVYSSSGGSSYNFTGSQGGQGIFEALMAFPEIEVSTNSVYSYSLLTSYFHQVGGTNALELNNAATGQSVLISYQTYEANSPNESFGYCGSSFTYSSFTVEIGTVGSTSTQVLASLAVNGTENSTPVDFSISLFWVALAG